MRFLSLLLLLSFSYPALAQLSVKVQWSQSSSMPASDIVYYDPENKLDWNDFVCKPPSDNGKVAAITMSGFGYSAGMRSNGSKGVLNIQVYCFFNKNKSWVKPGKTNNYILTHEQHHFDISYIAANIFADKIQSAVVTMSNYNVILPRIYNECIDIMNKMQDEYDGQTRNGQEKELQDKWNRFIDDKISLITR